MSTMKAVEPLDIECINQAWAALAQGDHALACEVLTPYAHHTTVHQDLAEVWVMMLGAVDDERHLSYEFSRLASRWVENPQVVLAIAQSALKWANRSLPLRAPPRQTLLPSRTEAESSSTRADLKLKPVIWLAIEMITYCLEHAAPSQAHKRALLYLARARLLCWAGGDAEDDALHDFEITLTLDPHMAEAWYALARLHVHRGRWAKSLVALSQARSTGLESLQLTWLELLARTALGGEESMVCPQLWAELNHEGLMIGVGGRAVKRGYEPQLVALHSHMVGPNGGYDLTQTWALERVWVQPLSPCHGRVLHPTLTSLSVGYDDLVLWEPQAVSFEEHEDDEKPIFRAIACLERGQAHSRPLPRPQLSTIQLETLNQGLPEGVFYYQAPYAPLEQQGVLCWRRGESLAPILDRFEALWRAHSLPTKND